MVYVKQKIRRRLARVDTCECEAERFCYAPGDLQIVYRVCHRHAHGFSVCPYPARYCGAWFDVDEYGSALP